MATADVPTAAAEDRRLGTVWLVLLALTLAWAVLWFVHALHYWEDDAYIHLEFARSLSRGAGFAFNGHVVYGDTSPLWVGFLAGAHAAMPDWMTAGKALTAAAAVTALGGFYALARRFTVVLGQAQSRVFAAAVLLLVVTNPYFGYWAFSGMEALLAAGLVCWALTLAGCEGLTAPLAPGRYLLACTLAGVAPLLRPEMVLFSLLLGLALFFRWVNMPVRRPAAKLLLFFGGLALAAGPGVAWAVYAARTFGSVLPNTDAAKRAGPSDSVVQHLLAIYGFGFPLALLGLAGLLLWWAVWGRRDPQARQRVVQALPVGGWLLVVWTLLNGVFYIGNHTYVQTRYIFVTAPVLTLALLALGRKLLPEVYRAAVVLGICFGVAVSLLATWPLIRNKVGVDRVYASLAAELRSLPPREPVAYYSIGEAAFLSEHPIVDTGGITRPGVIPFLWDPTVNRTLYWAHEQGARYMIVADRPEPGSVLVWQSAMPVTGWSLNPRRYRGTEELRLWRLPRVPTIPLPAGMPVSHSALFGATND